MFELKHCIRLNNGKIYCWDNSGDGGIIELDVKPIATKDVPSEAVELLIKALIEEEHK